MKIQTAIMCSNSDPLYLDFWPLVSKVWRLAFDVEPLLVYIDEHDVPLDETYGRVVRLKPIPGIPIYLQTLWCRYWFPCTEPETTFILTDIDMFPISRWYFIQQIAAIDPCKYVHLNPAHNPFPTCYHIAKGKKFAEVLGTNTGFEETLNLVIAHHTGPGHEGKRWWSSDEDYATLRINAHNKPGDFVFLVRQPDTRLDRPSCTCSAEQMQNRYYDNHSVRPYSQYRTAIDAFIANLLDTLCQKSI